MAHRSAQGAAGRDCKKSVHGGPSNRILVSAPAPRAAGLFRNAA